MGISAVSTSTSLFQSGQTDPFAQFKNDFDSLGSALQSGNLEEAKKAYAQLQKNAPAKKDNTDDPMSTDMESLGNALESGDLEAAQEIYSNIKSKMAQAPPPGGSGNMKGQQAGGTTDTVDLSSSGTDTSSESSSAIYDKKDTNKDGTVSAQEEFEYEMKHPAETDTDVGKILDTTA